MENEILAIKSFADKLRKRGESLKNFSLARWSTMTEVALLPTEGFYVYMIFAKDSFHVKDILDGLDNCKKNCKKCEKPKPAIKHFSRVNSIDCKDSCIYVGSSKSLKSRIMQHFDEKCYGRTYALHIRCYFNGDLVVKYTKIEDKQLMEDVEEALWNYYKPALGKSGQS